MNTEFDYIIDNYLNRARLALLGLNRVSEGELLSMEPFSTPLYELVYISAVTGVEEYLYHRLSKEVFENEGSIQKYIDVYNMKRKKKPKQHIQYLPPFSDEAIEYIKDTLCVYQTYHRLDVIGGYLKAISGFNPDECPSWHKLKPIIKIRHSIVHHGARYNDGERVSIKPYDVTLAFELAESFISEVEEVFVRMGKLPLIIDPRE